MTTLKQAKELLESVEKTEFNRTPILAIMKLIKQVEEGEKSISVLRSIKDLVEDAKKLNILNKEINQIKSRSPEQNISRAADMAKSRAKANFLRDVRLTEKAEKNLNILCESLKLNKTQVVNKLLEEQEQLNLL